ncbi:hypothetical protein BXZ70DRAFT_444355 [Cristinia sonorae]|uniref:Uncharacterized protein n=1 Tax=Cristinia sonorae TaxID=1940300 RepID=A0A8K0UI13_9AGAR|nr:hypothetical protein BXZ70DRAFT_444355 [Cristinia sonorae]
MFVLNVELEPSASPTFFKGMDSPTNHQKTVTFSEPIQPTASTLPVADKSTSGNAAPPPPAEDASSEKPPDDVSSEKRTRKRKRKRHSKKRQQLYFPDPIPPQLMNPPSSRYHFGAYVSKARIIEIFEKYRGKRNPKLEEGEPGWDELVFFEAILHQGWGAQSLLGLCDVELWHKAQYKDIASAYDTDGSVYVGVVRIEDGKGKQLVCSDMPALTVNKVKILEELCGTKPCWWGDIYFE